MDTFDTDIPIDLGSRFCFFEGRRVDEKVISNGSSLLGMISDQRSAISDQRLDRFSKKTPKDQRNNRPH
jgi:hypothetical protein